MTATVRSPVHVAAVMPAPTAFAISKASRDLLKSPHDPDTSPRYDFRQPRLAMVALI